MTFPCGRFQVLRNGVPVAFHAASRGEGEASSPGDTAETARVVSPRSPGEAQRTAMLMAALPVDITPRVTRGDLCSVAEKMFPSLTQVFDTTAEHTMISPVQPEKKQKQMSSRSLYAATRSYPACTQSPSHPNIRERGSCWRISVQKFHMRDRHKQA